MHIFIHLLNDFSGSPRIINEKISCYRQLGADCLVITSGNEGFIRTGDLQCKIISYEKHTNLAIWALRLISWHLRTFFWVLLFVKRSDVVHCSTLLTAPHLLAGRLKGARTVCHIMETKVSPSFHRLLLVTFVRFFACRVVYLSAYVETAFGTQFRHLSSRITYPCVDQRIVDQAAVVKPIEKVSRPFVVGLICSLVWYKGYLEFIQLARLCPEFQFILVINGRMEVFYARTPAAELPGNVTVRFNAEDISSVLKDIDMLVSLTRREGWVETFGLTLIEAMAFGVPVIAPDVGAPPEFVENARNGYLVNESQLEHIANLLRHVRGDPESYASMSTFARATADRFTRASFLAAVRSEMEFVLG